MSEEAPLWTPSPQTIAAQPLMRFTAAASARAGRSFADYRAVHAWSVEHPGAFWDLLWDFCGVIGEKGKRQPVEGGQTGDEQLVDGDKMPGACFFPAASLNFAENLLVRNDDTDAIVFRGEDGATRRMSWRQLTELVSRLQQSLAASGVGIGDRVAGLLPNIPEAIAAALATASLGAVWSSASPDFGANAVVDRFGQIEPKVFISCDGYRYAGKEIHLGDKLAAVIPRLPGLVRTIVVPFLAEADSLVATLPGAVTLAEAIAPYPAQPLTFKRVPFAKPLYILFSSGTTGVPKCIVHSVGGTLLQHLKEHRLHSSIGEGDRVFYFSTLGWMMWNWLVSALASRATLLLFDGSPVHPSPATLFAYAADERATFFGTSAKFIDAVKKAEYRPMDHHDLSSVQDHSLHRIAAGAGELRLRLRRHQARRPPRLDLRRHRYRLVLRARHPDRTGMARRDPGARTRHGGGRL